MAARTPQLALLIDQLMAALQTKPPVLAGNVIAGRERTALIAGISLELVGHDLLRPAKLFL
jgi:hypothetical protein